MSKKTKFNLMAGIGTVVLILFLVLGPRLKLTFGPQSAHAADNVPPGCVAIPQGQGGVTGGYEIIPRSGIPIAYKSNYWGTATCSSCAICSCTNGSEPFQVNGAGGGPLDETIVLCIGSAQTINHCSGPGH